MKSLFFTYVGIVLELGQCPIPILIFQLSQTMELSQFHQLNEMAQSKHTLIIIYLVGK